jgi:hypothetical protein
LAYLACTSFKFTPHPRALAKNAKVKSGAT